jgi:hypothetical protein
VTFPQKYNAMGVALHPGTGTWRIPQDTRQSGPLAAAERRAFTPSVDSGDKNNNQRVVWSWVDYSDPRMGQLSGLAESSRPVPHRHIHNCWLGNGKFHVVVMRPPDPILKCDDRSLR